VFQHKGTVYRVDRGDTELVVIPPEFIPELNKLGENVLSSRMAIGFNLLGPLSNMEIVQETGLYFKTIVTKLTPNLPRLTPQLREILEREIDFGFPRDSREWVAIEPIHKLVQCVSSGFAWLDVRAPLCNDPELVRLVSQQSVFGEQMAHT
jgi:hypothetical protein